jgi:tetratricopeptide (TPR) repeat protein
MAEEEAREPSPSSLQSSDSASWAALSAASREKADAFLEEQIRVARAQERVLHLQAEDLKRDDRLRHWSLLVRHTSDVMKVTFELAVAVIALALVTAIGALVWGALHDHGVVVEEFQVPKDFSDRGITGQALAGDILSAIAKMQSETDSSRPASTYANNWGDNLKVQIADTGLTLGDVTRFLHEWLGHQTRISGELSRSSDGIAITVRVGDSRATFSGKESDRDALVQRAAEAVYAETQLYRYGVWQLQRNNLAAAEAAYTKLLKDASPSERVWAYVGLTNVSDRRGTFRESLRWADLALALDPDHPMPLWDAEGEEQWLGWDEAVMASTRREEAALQASRGDVTDRARAQLVAQVAEIGSYELGDFATVASTARIAEQLPDYFSYDDASRDAEIQALGFLHDGAALRSRLAGFPQPNGNYNVFSRYLGLAEGQFALADWADALASLRRSSKVAEQVGPIVTGALPVLVWPFEAVAMYETGDAAGSRILVGKTPIDCMMCVIMRGRIDELDGKPNAAAFWYACAAHQAPSIPYPFVYWGAMLLHEGEYDAAIAKFTLANAKGPHFADPLEMWGEALMLKNRSDLALAKFEEANKYAPNWGRLHLKWGEALQWSGDKAGARAQFAAAVGLDLSAADKAVLTRMRALHG